MQPDNERDARLDALLRSLPLREIDPRVDARTLRAARAVLVDQPRGGAMHALQRFWERAVAPLLVTGTVASYLLWAFASTNALLR